MTTTIFTTGLPVRPMWFVERVFVPIEEQYKYVSDQDDDSDEEWTMGPKKKKRNNNDTIAVSTGEYVNINLCFFLSDQESNWV